jgi:hypothetical protein
MVSPFAKAKGRYRVSNQLTEILDTIESARTMGRNFVWHSVKGERQTFPVQIVDLRVEGDRSFVAIENKSEDFKVGETVYIRMDSRDAAFKSIVAELNDFEVVLDFPKEILLSDYRKLYRTPFSVGDHKTVRIRYDHQGAEKTEDILCLDVHEGGMAIFMVAADAGQFNIESTFQVIGLGEQPLPAPLLGEVVSKVDYNVKNQVSHITGFRMGIELSELIPKPILDQFSIRTSLYELSDEQLVRDAIFRKKVHENMKETLEKLSKHKLLKKFFAHLDFDRMDNDYVKIHIRLLCEILCGLGTRLGWVTDKTMDKLVYVAFMHDVALLQYPELAKIKSKRQLEALPMGEITEEEVKRYLEAPLHAAELARLDPESYPDAVRILLQQRELPDGSGFPYGINGSQLVPLSCLFIFSHYLVDYMINDPDWTITDFVKSHQWILKGTYFTKITQLLKYQL